jgi:hypothetical protein
MGMLNKDDGWRLPDAIWEQMEPLLPLRKPHPLGCHNPRVLDRAAKKLSKSSAKLDFVRGAGW